VHQADLALLALRVVFGLFLAAHGYNKFFGGGKLAGTAGWFESIGMRWPALQARLAASTEVGAGVLFALGLLTPLAAAGMIGVMFVASYTHRGFFVFKDGWEYSASIGVVAWAVATVGPGRWSLDHAIGLDWDAWGGWIGCVIAGAVGLVAAALQLAICYRPPAKESAS
jgi:putative oxidoreductase